MAEQEVRYLTQKEFSRLYSISVATVRQWIEDKKVSAFKLPNGRWQIIDPGYTYLRMWKDRKLLLRNLPILSTALVVDITGRHRRTIRGWIKTFRLMGIVLPSGHWRFSVTDVENAMAWERRKFVNPNSLQVGLRNRHNRLLAWARAQMAVTSAKAIHLRTLKHPFLQDVEDEITPPQQPPTSSVSPESSAEESQRAVPPVAASPQE